MTGQLKWVFYDPVEDESYTFETNPNQMDGVMEGQAILPGARSAVTPRQSIYNAGYPRILQGKRQPLEWTFAGNVRTHAHYVALRSWSFKPNRIHVSDHFGRTWEVLIRNIDFTEQRPTPRSNWRFTYEAECLMIGRLS